MNITLSKKKNSQYQKKLSYYNCFLPSTYSIWFFMFGLSRIVRFLPWFYKWPLKKIKINLEKIQLFNNWLIKIYFTNDSYRVFPYISHSNATFSPNNVIIIMIWFSYPSKYPHLQKFPTILHPSLPFFSVYLKNMSYPPKKKKNTSIIK